MSRRLLAESARGSDSLAAYDGKEEVKTSRHPLNTFERSMDEPDFGAVASQGHAISVGTKINGSRSHTFISLNGHQFDENVHVRPTDQQDLPESTYFFRLDIDNLLFVMKASYDVCKQVPDFEVTTSFLEFANFSALFVMKRIMQLAIFCGHDPTYDSPVVHSLNYNLCPPVLREYLEQMGLCLDDDQVGIPGLRLPARSWPYKGVYPEEMDEMEFDEPYDGFFPFGVFYHQFRLDYDSGVGPDFQNLCLNPYGKRNHILSGFSVPRMSQSRRELIRAEFFSFERQVGLLSRIRFNDVSFRHYLLSLGLAANYYQLDLFNSLIPSYCIQGDVFPPPISLHFCIQLPKLHIPSNDPQPCIDRDEPPYPPPDADRSPSEPP
jgi:hypothetical protein